MDVSANNFDALGHDISELPLKSIKVLETLLRNIVEHPSENKYRKLKLSNVRFANIWTCPACKDLLESVSFRVGISENHESIVNFPHESPLEPLVTISSQLRELITLKEGEESDRTGNPNIVQTTAAGTLSSSTVSAPTNTTILSADASLPYFEPVNDEGQSQLHLAAASGNIPTMAYLMTIAPEMVHMPDINGWLPLHEAVRSGSLAGVRSLIEDGHSDPSARTSNRGTPLWWARKYHNIDHPVVVYLQSLNAIDDGPDSSSDSGPLSCQICCRGDLHLEISRGMALFRASRPNIAIECTTCKQNADLLSNSSRSAGSNSNSSGSSRSRFVICGQCFNDSTHGHNPDHLLDVVGAENAHWRDARARGGGRPPPDPDSRNRRGPWG